MSRITDKRRERRDERPSLRRRVMVWLFNLFLLGCVGVAGYVSVIYLRMPSLDAI